MNSFAICDLRQILWGRSNK